MIRFIDLGDQILEGTKHFAWFDTVTDTFETYNYEQIWETWLEFKTAYRHDQSRAFMEFETRPLERYWGLFQWRKDWDKVLKGEKE